MTKEKGAKTRLLVAGVLAAAVLALCLAGCGQESTPESKFEEGLPAWADEADITARAHEIVELVNARDFDKVAEIWNDPNVTSEKLKESLTSTLDMFGGFQEYGETKYGHTEASGRSVATTITHVVYDRHDAQYNVSFYEDGSFAGLYVYRMGE